MQDCIFCKMVNGDIPCVKVYENESILCFLDIAPAAKGHCLVIPKTHAENILEISPELAGEMHEVISIVAKGMLKGLGADGFNVNMNNFKAAGQLVMHAHWHMIPRFHGDGLQLWPQDKYESEEQMQAFSQKIRSGI